MRRGFWAVIKIAVAAGLIVYAFSSGKINLSNLARLPASPGCCAGALLVLTLQTLVTAVRLKLLLRAHGEAPSLWTMVKITYVGAFFDLVAVTSVGGDAVKAVYLAREIPKGRRTESVSVLIVDRLMGLLGMLTLTVAAAAWSLDALWAEQSVRPYLLGLLIVGSVLLAGSFVLFSRRLQEWELLNWALQKLPFGRTFQRVYASMRAFRGRPRLLVEGWLLSLLVHVLGSIAGYLLAQGLGMHGMRPDAAAAMFDHPSIFFSALLMSNFISSFAPFGAIGVGQAAYAFVFERVAQMRGGADLATAIQAAFFIVKAPGAISWIAARRATEQIPAQDSDASSLNATR